MSSVTFERIQADGVDVFYRAAGKPESPTLLLLHGFPSSSFQFRTLLPLLAADYRVLAPDLPGFGFTDVPAERQYAYTFDGLSKTVEAFVDALGLTKFALYVFDYGAPTGLRLALRHPDRVTAIITQNGNAYAEGLASPFWAPLRAYWALPAFSATAPEAAALDAVFTLATTRWQYTDGVPGALLPRVDPAAYTLDALLLARAGQRETQLALCYDYGTNPGLYPAFQAYFRESGVPVLVMWGANDAIFPKAGAEAYARDVRDVVLRFVDTGHFALETHVEEFAREIRAFLSTRVGA
ncbi:alpha/beta hydrolase fold protein [Amylostereum chailletii]|nr:alpha/beta hydrolase fold protein [Amylostereum chailletii]